MKAFILAIIFLGLYSYLIGEGGGVATIGHLLLIPFMVCSYLTGERIGNGIRRIFRR